MSDESDGTPFDDFLRSLLGDEAGEEAARAMRAQGFDPSSMPAEYSDPAHLEQVLNQFRFIMSTTSGPVNWGLVEGAAKQQAFTAGDPRPSAAEAAAAKQAMTVADLWLDTVTDFSAGPAERQAWSRAQWIDATLPMWKRICEPVAANVSRALSAALEDQMGEGGDLPAGVAAMLGQTQEMMPKLSAMMFASQIGRALSALAQEAIGSYDVGIPLAPAGTTALLPHNIAVFSEGLDIDFTEVRQFMAVREAAHRRLFASVPWLSGDLLRAVEAYSAEIAIDPAAIARAAGSVDPSDPESIERALSGGVFAISVTEAQHRALTRLETLLALIEGWVEVVTAAATAPYLPHSDQLREMMRRRRASGSPAEEVLGRLIGLKMRPRRARGAASIFSLVAADGTATARDALWSHPDMVPTMNELDSPDTFLTIRRAALEQDADIDAALNSLLDGTMGWAEGLSPQDDPEAETLREAGFAPEGADSDDGAPQEPGSPGEGGEGPGAPEGGGEGPDGTPGSPGQ